MKLNLFLTALLFCFSCTLYAQNGKRTKMQITTTEGNIVIELYNETPVHRDNFIKLVKEKFFDGLLFHRCIKSFMIQGGDPLSRDAEYGKMLGEGDVGYTLPAEIKKEFVHIRGALAAARLGDQVNPEKRSSGCQFYIVQGQPYTPEQMERFNVNRLNKYTPEQIKAYTTVGGTPHLDGDYTVFGQVVSGLDVIEKISLLETDRSARPLKDVKMTIKIIK